ncbi:hypothetical protein ACLX1H_006518 [Fusarium chlamydosporum]
MVNRRRITDLPPEIRRQIFGNYFKVSGGYIYDGKSDKLRNADETPIDLSLIYTCRLIAEDCRNLPLAVNTIHFHTLYPRSCAASCSSYLPHWVGKYPAESFFDLRFEYWAIPERYQVSNVLDLLGISSLVCKLPDMWYSSGDFMYKSRDRHTPDQLSDELDRLENPRSDFEIRVREKIRFSATAAAIRFLGLIPDTERTGIRTIIIHEDFPSVNRPPLHGNGLIPFLQENTLLRIERRIHVVDTIFHTCSGPEEMTERLTQGPLSGIDDSRVDKLFTWLLDALAVGSRDIPVGSLTLLLESGSRSNICTEIFQELIHARFALGQAVRECSETGILRSLTSRQMTWLKREFGFENEFSEAINQLVSQRSDILRCDFSPGLPQSHQAIVDAVKEAADVWDYFRVFTFRDLDKPDDWESEGWNTEMYEIETQDDYLRSLSRS